MFFLRPSFLLLLKLKLHNLVSSVDYSTVLSLRGPKLLEKSVVVSMKSAKKSRRPCARNENEQWEYHNPLLNENYPGKRRKRKLDWVRESVHEIESYWEKHPRREVLWINLG